MKKNAAERALSEGLARLSKQRLVAFIEELAATDGRLLPQIESLLSEDDTPAAVALTRRRLAALGRGKKHHWGFDGAEACATELDQILGGIERGVLPGDPAAALELLAAFIDCDAAAFERADDSHGQIGDVFRRACALFGVAAKRCPSSVVLPLLMRLWADDGYGARGTLMRESVSALDAPSRMGLIAELRCQMQAAEQPVAHPASVGLMEIADALGDPELYEEACLFGPRTGHPVFSLHTARRFLRAGRAEEALARMPPRAEDCGGYAHEWTATHTELLRALGRTDELRGSLWKQFASTPSKGGLDAWLASAPEAEHPAMLARACTEVRREHYDPATQARFFVAIGDIDEAASCTLRRPDAFNGDHYETLQPLAKSLADAHPLAASILYRALLEANLRQALSKYYSHGVRYWRALDALAPRVAAWAPLVPHADYVATLRAKHARKTSFWAKVS